MVPVLKADDLYFLEFSNTYGTQLDCQLHKELCEVRSAVDQLARNFPENEHVLNLAPVVHLYAAYAKTEENPFFAFELADFCRTVAQTLSHGLGVLYDASLNIGKGAHRGIREFFSLQHWYEMGNGIIQMGVLCIYFASEPNLAMLLSLPDCFHHPDTINRLAKKDCLRVKAHLNVLYQHMQDTYQKIQNMPWQELVQKSAHITTLTILQILTFHAFSNFLLMESVVTTTNTTPSIVRCASTGYSIEIEGLKRFIIDNPPLVPTKITAIIEKNHSFLTKITENVKNLKPILPNIKNVVEKRIGTVWNNIKPTDLMYPGTKIPKSFELTVGNQKFWVAPNGTKHMLGYLQGQIATHNIPINSQSLLAGFEAAVNRAISQGIVYRKKTFIDCWDLMFDTPRKEGLLPTIYHANFKPTGWMPK